MEMPGADFGLFTGHVQGGSRSANMPDAGKPLILRRYLHRTSHRLDFRK